MTMIDGYENKQIKQSGVSTKSRSSKRAAGKTVEPTKTLRKWHFTGQGVTVEAETLEQATKKLSNKK